MADEDGVQKVGLEYVSKYYDQFIQNAGKANSKVAELTSGLLRLAAGDVSGAATTAVSMLSKELSTTWGKMRALVALVPLFGPLLAATGDAFMLLLKKIAPVADAVLGFGKSILGALLKPLSLVGDAIGKIFNITFGILIADFVRSIGNGIQSMARDAFDAASNFQLLKIRMQGLMARDIISGTDDLGRSTTNFGRALQMVEGDVKQVFKWIRDLAVQSPFTIEDITNAFTLAKAYGLGTEETKKIVSATMEFAAAMGLTGDHIQRVIENFGQMIQQGKITGTEIRDLARGSFVPVTELFAQMGEAAGMSAQQVRDFASRNSIAAFKKIAAAMGLTTEEITKLADEGKLSTELFMKAFTEVVKRDFPDAGKRMSQTLATVISNIKDFTQAVLGWEILGPIVDKVSGKIADILEILLNDPRLEKFSTFFGSFISGMFDDFLNFDPQKIVDIVMGWVNAIKLFLTRDTIGIDTWEKQLQRLGIPKEVTDSIDNLMISWDNLKQWWDENGSTIVSIIADAFNIKLDKNALPNLTGGLRDFTQYMLDHGDEINEKIRNFLEPIKHFIENTWPLFRGDKRITDIVDPTRIEEITGFLQDVDERLNVLVTILTGKFELNLNVNQGAWRIFRGIMDAITIGLQKIVGLMNILGGTNYSLPIGGGGTYGGGKNDSGKSGSSGTSVTSGQGTTTNSTVINVNVAANYSQQQSSAGVTMDINAALAALV